MGRMFLDGSLPRPDLRQVNRNTARLLITIEALTSPSLKNQSLASIFESALRQQWKGSNGNLQVQLSSEEAERIVSQQYPYI